MKHRLVQVSIESIACLGFVALPLILVPSLHPFMSDGFINPVTLGVLITHSLLIVYYYFNFYWAIPRYFATKKYRTWLLIVLTYLLLLILLMLSNRAYNPLPSPPFRFARIAFAATILIRFVMVTLLSVGIYTFKRIRQAEQEKLTSELAFLKAQINPHFLFNTLNSIYALSVTKSDKAPTAITRLAAIMRYAIAENAVNFVPLTKELEHLNSYIELEKLRVTEKLLLDYNVLGETSSLLVAPLILSPLVENAFKYGVSASENCFINISVQVNGKDLVLKITNSVAANNGRESHGVGLQNLRKRLELLYAGRHELMINSGSGKFEAVLKLQLND